MTSTEPPPRSRAEARARDRDQESEDDFVASWRASLVGRRASIGVPTRGLSGMAVITGSVAAVVAAVIGTVLVVQAVTRSDGPPEQNAALSAVQLDSITPAASAGSSPTPTPKVDRTKPPKKPAEPTHRAVAPAAPPKTGTAHTKTATRTVTRNATKTTTTKASTKTSTPVAADPSIDLASGKPVQAAGHTQDYVVSNITDGDVNTYWEAEAGFPQTVTVDLGSVQTVGRVDLALPPASDWNSRTQTIAIGGSRDGSSFTQIKAAAGYPFDANSSSNNRVSVGVSSVRTRYLRLTFTANSGWQAAQLSQLQVHSS